jgi:hypothetical protein
MQLPVPVEIQAASDSHPLVRRRYDRHGTPLSAFRPVPDVDGHHAGSQVRVLMADLAGEPKTGGNASDLHLVLERTVVRRVLGEPSQHCLMTDGYLAYHRIDVPPNGNRSIASDSGYYA